MSKRLINTIFKIIALNEQKKRDLSEKRANADLDHQDDEPRPPIDGDPLVESDNPVDPYDDDDEYDEYDDSDPYEEECDEEARDACKENVRNKHGTRNEIRAERDACIESVGKNHCPDGAGAGDYCNVQEKLCNCDKDYMRNLCIMDRVMAACTADNGCELTDNEQKDLDADCMDPSIWDRKKSCRDAESLCGDASDNKKCAIIKSIIDKTCKPVKDEALKAAFELCYSVAMDMDDKDKRGCKICQCGKAFVQALSISQKGDCNKRLASGCPAGSEDRRMKEWNKCMEKITDPTDSSGWYDKCWANPGASACKPPTKPRHWGAVKGACSRCQASGGGDGGAQRPDILREPRPSTRPSRPRPNSG